MTLFLKPAEGRIVDQEDGSPWPAGGLSVEPTLYVRRRLADLDLVPAEPEPEPSPEAAPEPDPIDPPAVIATPPAPVEEPAATLRRRSQKPAGEA